MGTAPVLPLLRGGGGESGRGRRTRNGWVVGWLAQRAGGHEEENFPLVVLIAESNSSQSRTHLARGAFKNLLCVARSLVWRVARDGTWERIASSQPANDDDARTGRGKRAADCLKIARGEEDTDAWVKIRRWMDRGLQRGSVA